MCFLVYLLCDIPRFLHASSCLSDSFAKNMHSSIYRPPSRNCILEKAYLVHSFVDLSDFFVLGVPSKSLAKEFEMKRK